MIARRRNANRFFWGFLLTALGLTFLLNNLNIATYDLGDLIQLYWPVIPIYFGVAGMLHAALSSGAGSPSIRWGSLFINGLWTAFFVAILGNIHFWWDVDASLAWSLILPAFLIFAGITLLSGGMFRTGGKTYVAVMSGARDVRTHWDDLSIIAVMGGARIDLSQCGLPEREVTIDVVSVMGGGELIVPAGVSVECDWTGIMGGVKVLGQQAGGLMDSQRVKVGAGPVVRIRAMTVMGGFDVK